MAESTMRMNRLLRLIALLAALVVSAPALAQSDKVRPRLVVAIPPLPTPKNVPTDAGDTGVIGIQMAQLITADLRSTGLFMPLGPDKLRPYSPTEAGAPQYQQWQDSGAGALVTGFVQARDDGRITVACYLYDLKSRRELARRGFVVAASDWRRAAHRCADSIYASAAGVEGHFDTRIAYVAESGSRTSQVKRLAIMDLDGTNHRYLTAGEVPVLNPEFSPDGRFIAYTSFGGSVPHIRLIDLSTDEDRPLVQEEAMSFAPRFSPDGRRIAYSMAADGNTDIYVMDVNGGFPQRLTSAPGSDTAPSFSPDGMQIVFESDRSGSQQLYVMSADGSQQRRISFGGGAYASPVWSPQGELIAFTTRGTSGWRIGVTSPSGADERLLTEGWQDEAPSWAPNGQLIVFRRIEQGTGRSGLFTVPLGGGQPHRLPAPQDGSEPSWSPPSR